MFIESRLEIIHQFRVNNMSIPLSLDKETDSYNDGEPEIDCSCIYIGENNKYYYHEALTDESSDVEISLKVVLQHVRLRYLRVPTVYVNAYAVSRHYGGPEEGGWYYDVGRPIDSIQVLKKKAEIEKAKKYLSKTYASEYERNHTRYSVLGGEDFSISIETTPGEYWPKKRPYYS